MNKMIIAIVRNYRGLEEINYLMTVDDFKRFARDGLDDVGATIDELKSGETIEGAFWGNDTFFAWALVYEPDKIRDFLSGAFNDSVSRMVMDNYDDSMSLAENFNEYGKWVYYFDADNSSKEIVEEIKKSTEFANLVNEDAGITYAVFIKNLSSTLDKDDPLCPEVAKELEKITHIEKIIGLMSAEGFDGLELVEFFDEPGLFSNGRIDRSAVPDGLHVYDFRESDNGNPFCTVEPVVIVNHGGSIITPMALDFGETGFIVLDEDTGPNFGPDYDI